MLGGRVYFTCVSLLTAIQGLDCSSDEQTASRFSRRISCKCSCCPRNQTQVYNEDEQHVNVTSGLAIATDTLSANVRKYLSIPDYRSSSTFLGTTAILFITLVCVFVSLPDILAAAHRLNRKYKLVERFWLSRKCRDGLVWLGKKWRGWDRERFWRKADNFVSKIDRCGLRGKMSKLWARWALIDKLNGLWTSVKSTVVNFCSSCRDRLASRVCGQER